MSIAIIIQARLSSARLPLKALKLLKGRPMLGYTLDRLRLVQKDIKCILATSTETEDDALEEFAGNEGISCTRGPLHNVAERFALTIREHQLSAFIRVCGDSPFIDPKIILQALELYDKYSCDLVTNILERTYPKGMSVELLKASTYLDAYQDFNEKHDQEHVTPFFYRHPEKYHVVNFKYKEPCPEVQLSVDSPEDFLRAESLIQRMTSPHENYGLDELLALVKKMEGT